MPRPARADAREALLDAARDEFARRGLDRARVEDIARRAGISKGAFYLHFAAKEDAFREIVSRFLGALNDHALRRDDFEAREGRRAPDGGSVASRIEAECAMDADLLEVLWRNRQILLAVEGASAQTYRDLLADFRRRMRLLVSHRLAGGYCAGARVRDDVPPGEIADIVVGAYEGLTRRMLELKEKPDLRAWARSLLTVVYEGILARPAGARPRARRARPRPPDPDPLVTSKEHPR
jgi:AcrR family transcriptional regulator